MRVPPPSARRGSGGDTWKCSATGGCVGGSVLSWQCPPKSQPGFHAAPSEGRVGGGLGGDGGGAPRAAAPPRSPAEPAAVPQPSPGSSCPLPGTLRTAAGSGPSRPRSAAVGGGGGGSALPPGARPSGWRPAWGRGGTGVPAPRNATVEGRASPTLAGGVEWWCHHLFALNPGHSWVHVGTIRDRDPHPFSSLCWLGTHRASRYLPPPSTPRFP